MVNSRSPIPASARLVRSESRQREFARFAAHLSSQGYTLLTRRLFLPGVIHFLYFEERQQRYQRFPDKNPLFAFLCHLGWCQCRWRSVRLGRSRPALRGVEMFLRWCQEQGLSCRGRLPEGRPSGCLSPSHEAFQEWLVGRSVGRKSLETYHRIVSAFTAALGEEPARYTALEIRRFLFKYCRGRPIATTQSYFSCVRVFLRFLASRGWCSPHLEASVPSVRGARESAVRSYLSPEEVERLIGSCDLSVAPGLRDRAILLLLARLGLRACEVARLRFQDVDWERATLRIRGKGGRQALLPLPQQVGEALLDYLEQERPASGEESLFLCAVAPWRPLTAAAFFQLATRAYLRAQMEPPSARVHVLRHATATNLLRGGASLQDVAGLLRHSSLETTKLYAKVNPGLLAVVAEPWPEALS